MILKDIFQNLIFSLLQYMQWWLKIWASGEKCRKNVMFCFKTVVLFIFDIQISFPHEFLTSLWPNFSSLTFANVLNRNPIQGVPIVAQQVTNPTSSPEEAGLIPGLTQRVKDLALP